MTALLMLAPVVFSSRVHSTITFVAVQFSTFAVAAQPTI